MPRDNNRLALLSILLLVALLSGIPPVVAQESGFAGVDGLEQKFYGQKYPSLSLETRLRNLERKLNLQPQPGASLEYRLNQIYRQELSYLSEDTKQGAIQAYNRGVDAQNAGQTEEAVRLYREALHHNPALIQAANNLGNLLYNSQRYKEAIEMYQNAIRYMPTEPLLYRNLGVAYERTGQIREAVQVYKKYMALNQAPDPPIEAVIQNFDTSKGASSGSYVAAATSSTSGQRLVWKQQDNPVTVFIQMDNPSQVVFLPMVQQAIGQWAKVLGEQIRFQEVSRPEQAKILVVLTPGPISHPYLDVAHAVYNVNKGHNPQSRRMRVTITVNTGEMNSPLPLDNLREQVKRLAMHELGHALGIWGHSANPDDIMYTHPIVSKLSTRDIRTIQELYALTP